MIQLRSQLEARYGEKAGRVMVVAMCQERGLNPVTDEPTEEMWRAVK